MKSCSRREHERGWASDVAAWQQGLGSAAPPHHVLRSLFLSLALAGALWADKVHLKTGGTLEGQVTYNGDKVVVTTKVGSATFRADEILGVERVATAEEEYRERAKALKPDDAQGHYQLALWCLEKDLKEQADAEARAALVADAGHEGAHRLLGHVLLRGRWVTEAEQQAEVAQAALSKFQAALAVCRTALGGSGTPAVAERVSEVDALAAQLTPALAANLGTVGDGFPAGPLSPTEADKLLNVLRDVFGVAQRVSLAGLKDPEHLSRARQLVADYFRAAPGPAEGEVLAQLRALADVSPVVVAALAQEGLFYQARPAGEEVRRAATDSGQVEYVLVTPPGYDPRHAYPLLVVCPGAAGDGRQWVERWREPAQAHGYLLASPTIPYQEGGYGSSPAERSAVLAAVEDVARTCHVDPDRVFLTGISAGGHAVWDVGLHHADRFAGLITESGIPVHEGGPLTWYLYLANAQSGLAVYALVGELDTGFRDVCTEATKRLQALGADATLAVVPKLGHGAFPTENDSIFAWMASHRRNPAPRSVFAYLHRLNQGRVYWAEVTAFSQPEWDSTQDIHLRGTFPADMSKEQALELARAKVAHDLPSLRGSVDKGNVITITANGVTHFVLWLSPQLVDFSRPVTVVVNGVTVWNGPVTPEVAVLLGEMKRSGDLGRVFFAALECDVMAKPAASLQGTGRVREGR
jgi:predicted esterase